MKKLFLLLIPLFLLSLSLGLGQIALADDCLSPNECKAVIDCYTTLRPADNCPGSQWCCDAVTATTCTSKYPTYSCVDSTGKTACLTGLCLGEENTNIKCCSSKEMGDTGRVTDAENVTSVACNPSTIPAAEVAGTYKGCTADKCGSKGYCGCKVTSTEGYSCVNVKKTADLTTKYDCKSNMCPGASGTDQEEKCCKPKSGGTTTPGANGGTVGGGGGTSVSFKPGDLSPVGAPSVPELIGLIVKGALGIVGSISLLMFVYGGFMLLISQGDAGKITKGKSIMVWAAVGLIVIFGSFIFVSYIITELSQNQGGGGGATQTCGQGTLTGYSCMDYKLGTNCQKGLCPGGADNQCCKAK